MSIWGSCGAPCPWDIFPIGDPDGVVGPGDQAQLIAEWGHCDNCELSGGGESEFFGGDGGPHYTADEVAQYLGFANSAAFTAALETATSGEILVYVAFIESLISD